MSYKIIQHFKKIPFFYVSPYNIIMLDDSKSFLTDAGNYIEFYLNLSFSPKAFTNPKKAIDYLNSLSSLSDALSKYWNSLIKTFNEEYSLWGVPIATLNHLTRKERINTSSIFIVDYNMPQLDGEEVLKIIKESTCKKILLTGAGDQSKGISLLNKRMIDFYVSKEEIHYRLPELICDAIYEIYWQYTSEALKENKTLISLISNNEFINFFKDTCQFIDPIEFYNIDKFGSFIFIDTSGKTYLMVLRPANVINTNLSEYKDMVHLDKFYKNEKILLLLKEKKSIPVLYHYPSKKDLVSEYFFRFKEYRFADQDYLVTIIPEASSILDIEIQIY